MKNFLLLTIFGSTFAIAKPGSAITCTTSAPKDQEALIVNFSVRNNSGDLNESSVKFQLPGNEVTGLRVGQFKNAKGELFAKFYLTLKFPTPNGDLEGYRIEATKGENETFKGKLISFTVPANPGPEKDGDSLDLNCTTDIGSVE